MTENPFGDPPLKTDKRNYLLLISMSQDNAAIGQRVLANIKNGVDSSATPLWIDSKGVGIFVTTDLVAFEIWKAAFTSGIPSEFTDTRDLLIVELGHDWAARRDAKTEHWLSTHVGSPRYAPRRR